MEKFYYKFLTRQWQFSNNFISLLFKANQYAFGFLSTTVLETFIRIFKPCGDLLDFYYSCFIQKNESKRAVST